MDSSHPKKGVVVAASLALLAFSTLTALALIAWFTHVDEPWSWKAAVAVISVMLGVTTSALVWRVPSRIHLVAGIMVMVMSLLRIGPPEDWSWVSFTLIAVTILLMLPLVHAALVIDR